MKDKLNFGLYKIEIIRPIAYMPLDMYTQVASYNDTTKRFYIRRGAAGGISIGLKSVKILEKV